MKLSTRVQGLESSIVFELLKTAKTLKDKGEDVLSLSIGELQWNTYKPIQKAAKKAIEDGYTKYCPSAGRQTLREKLAQVASKRFNIPFDFENVFVGNGCKYVLSSVFQVMCEQGDEVILPAPYWMSYPSSIQLSGAKIKPVITKEENNFKITANQLQENITDKTKAFVLNSPNNPTSAVYSEKELQALGKVLSRHPHVVTMFDAIYDRLVYSGTLAPHLLALCPHLKDQILAFNGASKTYLMTGWRLGWVIGPKDFIKVMSKFQSQNAGCANSIAQKAFEDGFSACESDIKATIEKLKHLRDLLTEGLKQIQGLQIFPSEGGFYLWIGLKNFLGKSYKGKPLNNSKQVMDCLLDEKRLICVCGEEFGLSGYLRLSYVLNTEDTKKAITRLQDFFSNWK